MDPDTRMARGGGLPGILRAHPLVVDALVAVGLTLLSLVTIAGGAGDFGSIEPLSFALILLQTLPLVARRIAPVPVFAITFGALLWQALFAGDTFNSSLGALVALFTVAERASQRVSIAAAAIAASGIAALIISRVGIQAGLSGLVQSLLTVFVVWLVGTWAQERRRYIGAVEDRATRAEREREQRTALAVAQERERIARELHDVVSHHVSVIVIQAGAALRALDRRPADARTALEAIDGSARAAMTEMRRMLGILGPAPTNRDDGAPTPTADDSLAPMPGLARLGELLEQVRATGQRVELAVEGDPVALDPGLDLTAYRIVQEALTNTLKHAPDGHVAVTLRYEPAMLTLEVIDDGGRGRTTDGTAGLAHGEDPGHGVIGMIERAALFGGTLEAGRHGRGFRVAARLPIETAVAGAMTDAAR